MSVSLGLEGAVPSVLVLVASAPAALSVITVRALVTMNYGRPGHEVLIHIPGAHYEIVERHMRYLSSADSHTSASSCGSRRSLYSRAAARGRTPGGRHGLPGSTGIRRRDQAITLWRAVAGGRTSSPGRARRPGVAIDSPGAPQPAAPEPAFSGRLPCVSSDNPDLHMLNVIVQDMAASLDFYQRLGIAVPADAVGAHVQLTMPGRFSLELDTAESAQLWHAGWRADPASARVVLGFMLASRKAVDDRYAELTAAGYRGRQPPFDAFWGARYAVVADPDGNDVGLMSPVEESRRTWPPPSLPLGPDARQHPGQAVASTFTGSGPKSDTAPAPMSADASADAM
jgi:catechol 2,3-dioxygenase-like lactoylglutathione lyase family enzyme